MKAYLVLAALALGFHGLGASRGWWKGTSLGRILDIRGGGGGGSGWGGGGFRGGK
jgi:hypothetical protein